MGNCLHFRHLLRLKMSSTLLPFSSLFILGGIIESGDVSLLEELRVDGTGETAGLIALVRGFRRGSCPHLHTLELPFYPGNPQNDEAHKHTDIFMNAVAEVLEERHRLGTCQGLKRLEGKWLNCGSVGTNTSPQGTFAYGGDGANGRYDFSIR
jgi:hypothetical protein